MAKVIITITDPRSTAQLINEIRARLEPMGIMDLEIRADVFETVKQRGLDYLLDELTREQITDRPPFVSVDI